MKAVLEHVKAAVVRVDTPSGSGAAFLVDQRGVLATCAHVVRGHAFSKVSFSDGKTLPGRVIHFAPKPDLAFMCVPLEGSYPSLQLASSQEISAGQRVWAVGHPLELDFSVTEGIVSSAERRRQGASWIQTDAAINPGNSGGPLVDADGKVVGIVSSGYAPGLSLAVPSSRVAEALSNLRARFEDLSTSNYCLICSNLSRLADRYCGNCGADFAKSVFALPGFGPKRPLESCRVCSGEIGGSPIYCPHCGAILEEQDEGVTP